MPSWPLFARATSQVRAETHRDSADVYIQQSPCELMSAFGDCRDTERKARSVPVACTFCLLIADLKVFGLNLSVVAEAL